MWSGCQIYFSTKEGKKISPSNFDNVIFDKIVGNYCLEISNFLFILLISGTSIILINQILISYIFNQAFGVFLIHDIPILFNTQNQMPLVLPARKKKGVKMNYTSIARQNK